MLDSNKKITAGWDIGGAHLKLALCANNDLKVFQWPCPLWKGLHELIASLDTAFAKINDNPCTHHVTMTGELVDIFDTREQGVKKILDTFTSRMPVSHKLGVFAGTKFLNVEKARENTDLVASANWLASGHMLSKICDNALLIDMGSSTTDLLLVRRGRVCNSGYSDAERLRSGELVYTGVVRSCVNTISHRMLYRGELVPMMAENFANSADVYRLLGQLPAHADAGPTMDGQAKDKHASARRLARMIGEDYSTSDLQVWEQVAAYFAQQQKNILATRIMEKLEQLEGAHNIVAAGVGRFLIKQIAQENNIPYSEFTDKLMQNNIRYSEHAADCAPAVALALM